MGRASRADSQLCRKPGHDDIHPLLVRSRTREGTLRQRWTQSRTAARHGRIIRRFRTRRRAVPQAPELGVCREVGQFLVPNARKPDPAEERRIKKSRAVEAEASVLCRFHALGTLQRMTLA
jgi:hypothetical protein